VATVKISLKNWIGKLDALDLQRVAERGMKAGALKSIPILHRATDQAPPASRNGERGANNTGTFRRSWKTRKTTRGVSIYNNQKYAAVVEGGRRKGAKMPPIDELAKWAQRRAGVSREEARRAAFAMARAIKARGLKPRNILRDSLKEIEKAVIDEIMYELTKEMEKK